MIFSVSQKSLKIFKNVTCVRFLTTSGCFRARTKRETQEDIAEKMKDWKTIYRLNAVRFFSITNRIKIYQGVGTALLSPLAYAAEASAQLPEGTFFVVSTIGITGFLSLSLYSLIVKNVVGFIYLNSAEDRIKLAYVGFLGERREAEYSVEDVIGADELPPSKYKYYYPLRFRNSSDKYMVLHKGGTIDYEKFSSVFGEDLA